MKINKKKLTTELRDYLMITIAMVCYCIGWTVFLLPNKDLRMALLCQDHLCRSLAHDADGVRPEQFGWSSPSR